MIEIKGLTKSFDGFLALDGVDMHIAQGAIYGLVGTNGSGKTTILKLLCGITRPDGGEILVDGTTPYESPACKARLAFIPDDLSWYSRQTLDDAMRFFRDLRPVWNDALFDEVTGGFGLDRRQHLSRFSKGMQKQAVFALSLASEPDCLILDEPIDGLDPLVRRSVWQHIVDATADRGMTTLVSSHNLREMEGFCDSIGILARGRMVLERSLDELTAGVHKLQVSFGAPGSRPEGCYRSLDVLHQRTDGSIDFLIVRCSGEALDRFAQAWHPVIFDRVALSLEEIFMYELGGAQDVVSGIF
jgi:ABC-2 type transport system ATP-binding protein